MQPGTVRELNDLDPVHDPDPQHRRGDWRQRLQLPPGRGTGLSPDQRAPEGPGDDAPAGRKPPESPETASCEPRKCQLGSDSRFAAPVTASPPCRTSPPDWTPDRLCDITEQHAGQQQVARLRVVVPSGEECLAGRQRARDRPSGERGCARRPTIRAHSFRCGGSDRNLAAADARMDPRDENLTGPPSKCIHGFDWRDPVREGVVA